MALLATLGGGVDSLSTWSSARLSRSRSDAVALFLKRPGRDRTGVLRIVKVIAAYDDCAE